MGYWFTFTYEVISKRNYASVPLVPLKVLEATGGEAVVDLLGLRGEL